MSRSAVLVVGSGIGGLSAAIALQQKAYETTVVERQSDVHSSVYGVGVIQPMNALRALDMLGCAQTTSSRSWRSPSERPRAVRIRR